MHSTLLDRIDLESQLRSAIAKGQLTLHYQPIVELESERVVGVEALVRWRHPTRGLLQPSEFIPLAEEAGLIVDLGNWVLDNACRQAAIWRRRFPERSDLKMSVNISPRQLHRSEFVQALRAVLDRNELPPDQLVLEITEGALMDDSPATMSNLQALKRLGVGLAIDDFGTGYSSLSYLQRFPVDVLKVDRSFIQRLAQTDAIEDGSAAFASAVIRLGETLAIATIAEGIETPEQVSRLTALGCELGQGFHIARPVDASAIETLLAAHDLTVPKAGDSIAS
jgi:EAL domain-containing protein (putative c-di-GMP-specific phosphodiesterase class I)